MKSLTDALPSSAKTPPLCTRVPLAVANDDLDAADRTQSCRWPCRSNENLLLRPIADRGSARGAVEVNVLRAAPELSIEPFATPPENTFWTPSRTTAPVSTPPCLHILGAAIADNCPAGGPGIDRQEAVRADGRGNRSACAVDLQSNSVIDDKTADTVTVINDDAAAGVRCDAAHRRAASELEHAARVQGDVSSRDRPT